MAGTSKKLACDRSNEEVQNVYGEPNECDVKENMKYMVYHTAE